MRSRNFLTGTEYRRLFWRFMPPAIVMMLALEWLTRSAGPPTPQVGEPLIDTRIESFADSRPAAGTVVIAPSDGATPSSSGGALAASAEALARVRDVAFFRSADHAAWSEICGTLRAEAGDPARPPAPEVALGELLSMPRSYRGRPVRLRGTLRRLEQLDPPAGAREVGRYWQGWLEPAVGPAAPLIVHLLELPAGMPTGLAIREPVVIDGYFLKTAAYRAADGVRVAPLILASTVIRPKAAAAQTSRGNRSLRLLAAGTLFSIVAALGFGFLAGGRGHRRHRPADAPALDAALAGFEPEPIAAALRRAAARDDEHSTGEDAEHSAGDTV